MKKNKITANIPLLRTNIGARNFLGDKKQPPREQKPKAKEPPFLHCGNLA